MLKKTIWEMGRDSLEEYRTKGKLPLIVVLDNVRSLNNIGSIFRTSDAFRVASYGSAASAPHPHRLKSTRPLWAQRSRWPGDISPLHSMP